MQKSAHCVTTKKAHKLLTHKLCLPPFVPGMSQGQTGLPLCKIRRKPGFVPGTTPLCPGDKPGLSRGHSRGVPRPTGPKSLCLCAFFLPELCHKIHFPPGLYGEKRSCKSKILRIKTAAVTVVTIRYSGPRMKNER